MKNITYVFSGSRKERFLKKDYEAIEFFYGLGIFNSKNYNLEIIEPKISNFFGKNILKFIDTFFKKIINLPVYMYEYYSFKNIKILARTDKLVLVNESTFCSLAPILFLIKIFTKIDVYVFAMGLYSKKLRFPKLRIFHFMFISLFSNIATNVFFLGEGEYKNALETHPKFKDKYVLFPFSVDTEFWSPKNIPINERKEVLFVGNDGNRDPELLIKIIEYFKNIQFNVVSNLEAFSGLNLKNLKLYKGSFGSKDLRDSQLRDLYQNARIIILPLKNTYQPSGQSVTLQAMSCERPVIISKTKGFWDNQRFINNKHLCFVENNSFEGWVSKFSKIYNDDAYLVKLEKTGKNLIESDFTIKEFEKKLLNYMGL